MHLRYWPSPQVITSLTFLLMSTDIPSDFAVSVGAGVRDGLSFPDGMQFPRDIAFPMGRITYDNMKALCHEVVISLPGGGELQC